ncbi:dTDP-4-dehydrorhamnose reductase [Chlorobaculum sp. MV4-Y]|jgi:dTDP-4-dehydrorhamnose reductase|uniref:dTDP-4-dehydrorhamnose reductase n=1 Tax=Chlorobaculum sp. MV4-Y TaxID=2976335 RepID=UPI0021B07E3A|nr:dTDP-4-dehydrorhamnose reductase [Chlorobaculum sp. MV4-Y]UWX57943.1 dTDP-4-dehydrorhamnose reductase [Chlorobaculum sp. MV4-Y]
MNILVTGSRGQLGSELQKLQQVHGWREWFFMELPELDITDALTVERVCRDRQIGAIVNCAAYTAVDRAESDAEAAFRVNRDGAAVLASVAVEVGALLLHISTDYVFDGSSNRPYCEDDPVAPCGVYGLSKWEGEEAIRASGCSYIILRTAWLYSVYGQNFVKTMLRLGSERQSIGVVFDQVGSPTWAADLAGAIVSIFGQCDPARSYSETFHYSNEGVCSWYDFAKAIMDAEGLPCKVSPIESSDYPTPAKRPHFSVLNKRKIKSTLGLEIPHWHDSLLRMLEELREGGQA